MGSKCASRSKDVQTMGPDRYLQGGYRNWVVGQFDFLSNKPTISATVQT